MAHITAPTQLRIAELDYDQILTNLVEFMKTDPTFSDYDFSGSGLNLIARVLAYVTFYNNYYLSAAVNESFLDTAQLRSSVVSHARMLGYQAHGTLSATYDANVTVIMDSSATTSVTLPKNTKFELQSNTAYVFYSLEDTTLTQNANNITYYTAPNVRLVEGSPATYQFTVDTQNPTQRFIIPNANVDYAHLVVTVSDSATSNSSTTFTEASNLVLASNTDNIYILQESYNGYPELKFGNDIVGRALQDNNIVNVDYYVSRGADGNNIRGPFRIATNIAGLVRGVTDTPDANTVPSGGGAVAEDIEQVRYLAPIVYGAQTRCVTTDDYKALILSEYGELISGITVFGAENGDPFDPLERPAYGRVYIVVKPKVGLRLTDTTRDDIIRRVVAPHSVVGVVPEVIDADYIYLVIDTRTVYDPAMTTRRRSELATQVTASIVEYTTGNIEKFDTSFRYSKLVRAIDETDPAIISSFTNVELQKRIQPAVGASNVLVIKFGAQLQTDIQSYLINNATHYTAIKRATTHRFGYTAANGTPFVNCWFDENGGTVRILNTITRYQHTFTAALKNGKIVETVTRTLNAGESLTQQAIDTIVLGLYQRNPGTVVNTAPVISPIEDYGIVRDSVGTFNANTGTMTLSNFVPDNIEDNANDIWINVRPVDTDLTPQLNRIFTLDANTVTVAVVDSSSTRVNTTFTQGGVAR